MQYFHNLSSHVHSSAIDPCQHNVAVLKEQRLQNKHHVISFANFVRRQVKSMTFKKLPKLTGDMLDKATNLGKATVVIS